MKTTPTYCKARPSVHEAGWAYDDEQRSPLLREDYAAARRLLVDKDSIHTWKSRDLMLVVHPVVYTVVTALS